MVDIKFCGLTRTEDAAEAIALGATHVGVIFAGGPRALSPERAADVFRGVPMSVRRVGVFGEQSVAGIASTARRVGLDVVQLHGSHDPLQVAALRAEFGGEIWPVVRLSGALLPANFAQTLALGDAVLLDALVPGTLGGTGVTLSWNELATALRDVRGDRCVILAGGLRAENVGEAIAALAPNIVDVSSGVESAPGIKDHVRMRAFREAVMHASISI